jgi:hypothetical protein
MATPDDLTFDWSRFHDKDDRDRGLRFQALCADLFRDCGYGVRVAAKGGGDAGRDIEVWVTPHGDIADIRPPDWWVECKARLKDAVGTSDVTINFGYAFLSRIRRLYLMTDSQFSNPVNTLVNQFNLCTWSPFQVATVERERLENLLRRHRRVYDIHFGGKTPEEARPSEQTSTGNDFEVTYEVSSPFIDDDPTRTIRYRSLSMSPLRVSVAASPAGPSAEATIEPLSELEIITSMPSAQALWPVRYRVNEKTEATIGPPDDFYLRPRIDHIFVDVRRHVDRLVDFIGQGQHVYVRSAPGIGKTRLLREASRRLADDVIRLDMSASSYRYSLLEHLIIRIIGGEISFFELLPTAALTTMLSGFCSEEEAAVLASFIRGESKRIDPATIINTITKAFRDHVRGRFLFIDNIHRFQPLDLRLLEVLLDRREHVVVCTARSEEFLEKGTAAWIDDRESSGALSALELDAISLVENISRFVEEASVDALTRRFLEKYRRIGSFQDFLFALKELRMLDVLDQLDDGRLSAREVRNIGHDAAKATYKAWVDHFKARHGDRNVGAVLRLAATFGYSFPDDLIVSELRAEGTEVLDLLIEDEFVVEQAQDASALPFRFDHELTRDLIYEAIPGPSRRQTHRSVIGYLRSIPQTSKAYSHGRLSRHHEELGESLEAARLANVEARRLQQIGLVNESYEEFSRGWKLIKRVEDPEDSTLALESEILIGMIDTGYDTGAETYDCIRALDAMRHLRTDARSEGLAKLFFGRHHSGSNLGLAFEYIDRAYAILIGADLKSDAARALNTKGLLIKKYGDDPIAAMRLHIAARLLYREAGVPRGESEALRNIGAVLLENGRGRKAVFWWRRAYAVLERSGEYFAQCDSLLDWSYISALYRPDDPENGSRLEAALILSRRLAIKHLVARAAINLANFDYFNGKTARALTLIDEAIEASGQGYLRLLSLFSRCVFQHGSGGTVAAADLDEIVELVGSRIHNSKGRKIADNRLRNIFAYLERFHTACAAAMHDEVEAAISRLPEGSKNQYEREGGLYATFY